MQFNFHKNHKLLFGTVFWGFLFLSLLISVMPALWVQDANKPHAGTKPMTKLEQEGLNAFVSEGCMYCHTQQVRPIKMDENWGRPSAPGDYARIGREDIWRQTPAVLGSERTGPDLSNVGKRQPSKVWQYMHLYNPRAVVKESVMPAFPWLFEIKQNPDPDEETVSLPEEYAPEEGKVVPTHEAKALVAYLLSLKQAPLNAGPSSTAGSESASASQPSKPEAAQKAADGATIYANNCAACHQASGKGVPGAFPPLDGDPVVNAQDPTTQIRTVLYGLQGKTIEGTAYSGVMQPFGPTLSNEEIAAVINHERSSWGNDAPKVTAADVKAVRENENLGKIQPGE